MHFPSSTLDKVFAWKGALKRATDGPLLPVAAITIETGCSIPVVAGVLDRAATVLLAVSCIVTARFCHQLWGQGDFFASGDSESRVHVRDLRTSFGLVGRLGLIAPGAPPASVGIVVSHPLSSTPA